MTTLVFFGTFLVAFLVHTIIAAVTLSLEIITSVLCIDS